MEAIIISIFGRESNDYATWDGLEQVRFNIEGRFDQRIKRLVEQLNEQLEKDQRRFSDIEAKLSVLEARVAELSDLIRTHSHEENELETKKESEIPLLFKPRRDVKAEVIAMLKEHPDYQSKEIASLVKCSPQYVNRLRNKKKRLSTR